MSAVPQPHQNWKAILLRGEVEKDHVRQFGQLLGQLHRQAFERETAVAREFTDDSFFESLRLEPYYAFTAQQIPQADVFLNALIADTRRQKNTLVHGDYSPKNILVHHGNLILIDHEVIHFGDPAFDLGFSLTHFLSKAHHLPSYRGAFAEAAAHYWDSYRSELGELPWADDLEERAVRHTLGCLLARVAGRSPLEYMDNAEQQRQQSAVLTLMQNPPQNISTLIDQFIEKL
jgi:aminoglycoside phosphotransferase (APT) family kinase protein